MVRGGLRIGILKPLPFQPDSQFGSSPVAADGLRRCGPKSIGSEQCKTINRGRDCQGQPRMVGGLVLPEKGPSSCIANTKEPEGVRMPIGRYVVVRKER